MDDRGGFAYATQNENPPVNGQVEFLEEPEEKACALNCIIRHLGKTEDTFQFPEAMLKRTCVYWVVSTDITGKHHE